MPNFVGDPNCASCKGRGFIYAKSLLSGGSTCICVEPYLRAQNLSKTWLGLEKTIVSENIKVLPPEFTKKSIWFTGTRKVFRQYLKRLVLQMPTEWSCRVRTDAELLDSWFGTAKAQGTKIFDLEVDESTLRAIDIPDLVIPPDLCIIWLGVKELPNKEAPSSLLEALNYRSHVGKPTWIVDQPTKAFDSTHRYYSEDMGYIISQWPHLVLSEEKVSKKKTEKKGIPQRKEISQEAVSSSYIDKWTTLDDRKSKWKK